METHRFSLNGAKYEIDLCADHAAQMYGQIMRWADLGIQTAEPTIFDRPRTLTPLVERVESTPKQDDLALVTHLDRGAQKWTFTDHALERMRERELDVDEVLLAASAPHEVLPCPPKYDSQTKRIHARDGVKPVVDFLTHTIVTVLPRHALTPLPVETICIDQKVRA